MTDDPNKKKLDRKLISLKEPHERAFWSTTLAISPEKLAEVVAKVGHSVDAVRKELAKK
jgi:Protein of unknown function (DUF3606)